MAVYSAREIRLGGVGIAWIPIAPGDISNFRSARDKMHAPKVLPGQLVPPSLVTWPPKSTLATIRYYRRIKIKNTQGTQRTSPEKYADCRNAESTERRRDLGVLRIGVLYT